MHGEEENESDVQREIVDPATQKDVFQDNYVRLVPLY